MCGFSPPFLGPWATMWTPTYNSRTLQLLHRFRFTILGPFDPWAISCPHSEDHGLSCGLLLAIPRPFDPPWTFTPTFETFRFSPPCIGPWTSMWTLAPTHGSLDSSMDSCLQFHDPLTLVWTLAPVLRTLDSHANSHLQFWDPLTPSWTPIHTLETLDFCVDSCLHFWDLSTFTPTCETIDSHANSCLFLRDLLTFMWTFAWIFAPTLGTLDPHVNSHPHSRDLGLPSRFLPALSRLLNSCVDFHPIFKTFNSCSVIISWFWVNWLGKWFWKVWNLPIVSFYMFKFIVFMRSLHINRYSRKPTTIFFF
jgi:hypothetical protein